MPANHMLDIFYFAWVAERIGRRSEQVDGHYRDMTIADLLSHHAGSSPGHAAAFATPGKLRAALDQRFVPLDTLIGDATELAIFPPVTGG
jgi:molybdopterin synthase sulfur carrier subunit